MTLDVYLRDITTGKTGVYVDTYPDDYPLEAIDFMWTEGNYACDCNRSNFLYGGEVKYGCESEKIVVDRAVIRETGQVLCEKGQWDGDPD